MAWVVSIREVLHVDVVVEEYRRGPVMTETKRSETIMPPGCWAQLLGAHVELPLHEGAGPCGTLARMRIPDPLVVRHRWYGRSPLTWSVRNLVEPLRAFYATFVPPLRFGAKPGPRGRKAA